MKFWNKSADSADIFIYGEIASAKVFDEDTTAKSFVEDLMSFNGADVTIHLNSGGGDCFAALAIYNTLKKYSGAVNVSIEGLCASAATIIACGGSKVTIAANSLMMIHNPSVGLAGYFDEADIDKVAKSLSAVKSTLVQTYQARTGKGESEIAKLLAAETWYTAEEAVANGFADEIFGEVASQFDDRKQLLFVNKLSVDCRKFDCEQLRSKVGEGARGMDEKTILGRIKALLRGKEEMPEPVNAQEMWEAEAARVKALSEMRDGTAAIDAIVDLAIRGGQDVESVAKYVDAVKKSNAKTEKTTRAILDLIEDNLNSGAEGVAGSAGEISAEDKRKAQAAMIAKFANEMASTR